jgi:outer membrane protein, heavy metal efflux system
MRRTLSMISAAALAGASWAWPGGLGLDSLIRMALAGNPDLGVGQAEVANLAQDTLAALAPANPGFGLEAFHNLDEPARPKVSLRLSQEFRPGSRARAGEEAKARWLAGKTWQSARDLDLAEAIRNEYAGWSTSKRKAGLQAEAESRWEALSRLAAAKVAEGRISQLDEAQIRLSLARTRQRIAELRSAIAEAEKRIGYLAGASSLPDTLRPEPSDSLPTLPPRDSLLSWAMRSNPEIEAGDRDLAAAKARIAFEEGLRNPSFSLSAGYDREADGANLVGAGLEIPLPLFNRNQAGIAKARAGLREAEAKRRAGEARLRAEVSGLADRLASLAERYRAFQGEAQPLGRKQIALSEKGFREGLLGVFDLSRAQSESLDQELEGLDLLESFQRAWNRLGRLTGGRI